MFHVEFYPDVLHDHCAETLEWILCGCVVFVSRFFLFHFSDLKLRQIWSFYCFVLKTNCQLH